MMSTPLLTWQVPSAVRGRRAHHQWEPTMGDKHSVEGSGYVLTPQGREALVLSETCECNWAFDGGLVVCFECGTVYSTKAIMTRTVGPGSYAGKQ
jgi:hypothetical protein